MVHLSRRKFLAVATAAVANLSSVLSAARIWPNPQREVRKVEDRRVLTAAHSYLTEQPRTITSEPAVRSSGGAHDYFSEGNYWWPDPKNPTAPYIRRDGQSNPANFIAHRELLLRLSIQAPALTAAWLLTRKRIYADHAAAHLCAWFVTPATRMNPNLAYAQAIHGIDTGRSIGIIDTLHLAEVARAALVLERNGAIQDDDSQETHSWFTEYLRWMTTSEPGRQERDEKNNHGSCWLLQAAAFAAYVGDNSVRDECRERLMNKLFPEQIGPDGSFPLELARTKPYSYSLFNLDVLAMSAHILSNESNDLWRYKLPGGRGLEACFRFHFPYLENKSSWPYRHDVEYFDDLPVRQPSLLFAGLAYREPRYLETWRHLDPDPTVPEVIRNHPIRQPLLWMK
jgi:hypothetical protein